MTEDELTVYDFCFGEGRAVPPSVFLGRVVPKGAPDWLPEDRDAALEWSAYQRSLCQGCRRPRHESFDPAMDDQYTVTSLQCHACAARDLRAWNRAQERERDAAPLFGQFYVVTPDEEVAADADVQVA